MIKLYFDGACEPRNPGGTAAYGFIIFREAIHGEGGFEVERLTELYRESKIVAEGGPESTNNVAEYSGLFSALKWLQKNNLTSETIRCYGDSRLVIYQLTEDHPETGKKWKVRPGHKPYKPVALKCRELVKEFPHIKFTWVPREKNIADAVSKQVLRDKGVTFRIQPE